MAYPANFATQSFHSDVRSGYVVYVILKGLRSATPRNMVDVNSVLYLVILSVHLVTNIYMYTHTHKHIYVFC